MFTVILTFFIVVKLNAAAKVKHLITFIKLIILSFLKHLFKHSLGAKYYVVSLLAILFVYNRKKIGLLCVLYSKR